ncbi:MAG: hypothetical protein CMG19_02315 [Candidatus Marinimicrobia bacterium]|nr:hypothetical protein [Candidatus Neomarinimicrobiota bacterium]
MFPAIKNPLVPMCFAALAGGMGWGIRGQYGHETGAMLAGLLVALVVVYFFAYQFSSIDAAKAVALATVAIGFGGSMTYGQTLGLTQDPPLIGNIAALRWGLIGTFIKGSIWIGFFGLFLGLGLGGKKYSPIEIILILFVSVFFLYLGIYILNEPFDPENKKLPFIYFSDDWYWEPGENLKPRREQWGGLALALSFLLFYISILKKDILARNMTVWGMFAGGLGFTLGQCVQAYHAWNANVIKNGFLSSIYPYINWWNMMEITFGAVFAFIITFGLWYNRHHISSNDNNNSFQLGFKNELVLLVVHIIALLTWNFISFSTFDWFADRAITMGIIPIVAIIGGRAWPYLICLPITALPIAGKTLRYLAYRTNDVSLITGWVIYFFIPLIFITWFSLKLIRNQNNHSNGMSFIRHTLCINTVFYFYMNWSFFNWPWPWTNWTMRTPSGIIFLFCTISLLFLINYYKPDKDQWNFRSYSK